MTIGSLVGASIVALSFAGSAAAQTAEFSYDPSVETSVIGTIVHVVPLPAADGAVGVHFDLKGPAGVIDVHLAPAMFIGANNAWFSVEDVVEVTGVSTIIDGNRVVIAREVKRNGKTLTLRAADGSPRWSAGEGIDGCGVDHAPLPRGTADGPRLGSTVRR